MLPFSVKPESPDASANRVRNPFLGAILDAAFPPRCAGCHAWNEAIFCPDCQTQLRFIRAPLCAQCGQEFDALAQIAPDSICADCRENRYHSAPKIDARRAPLEYSGPIRQAIHAFKYRGQTALAAPLAALLWEYSRYGEGASIPFAALSCIVPIPLYSLRRWRRGYNQSALLAQKLSALSQIPSAEVLRRVRHTQPQIELDARHRAANVRGAFAVDERAGREYSQPGSVLLLDDVATTGATLEECARVLKAAGAQNVYALTIARRD
jgi:ComF family protein